MKRIPIAFAFICLASGCGEGDGREGGSAAATSSAKPAGSTASPGQTPDAKPARKARTTLTEKQLKDVYTELKSISDFGKHRQFVVDKLGPPAREDGDKAFWVGIGKDEGAGKERCFQLHTSPTKGDGTSGADDAKCWE